VDGRQPVGILPGHCNILPHPSLPVTKEMNLIIHLKFFFVANKIGYNLSL
jgi:hypothetical protein